MVGQMHKIRPAFWRDFITSSLSPQAFHPAIIACHTKRSLIGFSLGFIDGWTF